MDGNQQNFHLHKTAYIAVAAAEMIMELTITAQFAFTRINANVDNAVAMVHIAKDFRRPRLVCIIQAPTLNELKLALLHEGMFINRLWTQDNQQLLRDQWVYLFQSKHTHWNTGQTLSTPLL